MDSITLHPKLGVNPRLTYCRRCGGETNELLLVGRANYKEQCPKCQCWHFGGLNRRGGKSRCGSCDHEFYGSVKRVELESHERLPSPELCDKCKEFLAQAELHAKDGAILGKCIKCYSEFVISGGAEIAKKVREQLGVAPPKLCGIELETCVNCEK